MVHIIPTEDPDEFRLEAEFESWYPLRKIVNKREAAYLDMIQRTIKVEDALGEWIPYRMCNHQVEWHLSDVTLMQEKAPIRVVKKSRNTSLTVNASISDIMAQAEFCNPVVPYVRLNGRSAIDLITQVKAIIKHITPMEIEIKDESRRVSPDIEPPTVKKYFPFNPTEVGMGAAGSITFPNGSQIRAFPASSPESSETIRGLRLRGNFGFIDESNFMRLFKNIFISMRDASSGSKKVGGKSIKIQQFTIGSTLKGDTPFSEWLEEIEKLLESFSMEEIGIQIYDWPVFRRDLFEPYLKGECDIPFHENDELISIVPWHDKEELWKTWKQDQHVFLEEYMGVKVESSEQFYPTGLIIEATDIEESLAVEELSQHLANYTEIRIGIDPATSNDYFGIAVWGYQSDGHKEQLLIEGHRGVELPIMQKYTDDMLKLINEHHSNWLCQIDATPIGMQLTQFLRNKYGAKHIRGLNGNMTIEDVDGNRMKLNAYGHTTMKKEMYAKKLHLIADELQIKHYKVWDYSFKAPSGDHGHGDLVMANLYALIPREKEFIDKAKVHTSGKKKSVMDAHSKQLMNQFQKRIRNKR